MTRMVTDEPMGSSQVEALLERPYWVIDFLPSQVPAGSEGRFFAVESLFLEGRHHANLRQRFAEVVLKLYCYYDILVFRGESERGIRNPDPDRLDWWLRNNERDLSIVLPSQGALLTLSRGSTHMTLHNPTPALVEQVGTIASASGLFAWQPPQEGEA